MACFDPLTGVRAQQDFKDDGSDGEVKMSSTKYSFKQAGFGKTPEEAMKEYGVTVNDFESYENRLDASMKLHFVYILHSELVEAGTQATKLHYDIIAPAIKEMKGLVNVLVFDCQHPILLC